MSLIERFHALYITHKISLHDPQPVPDYKLILSGLICVLFDLDPLIAVMAAFKGLNETLHQIQEIISEYACFFTLAIMLARRL